MARATRRTKKPVARRPRTAGAAAKATHAPLQKTHLAWLESVAAAVAASGGPRFTRDEVLLALVDAAAGRPIDTRKVKSAEDLRVAFGALDLSAVERMLRDRPRIEGGLLKALEDSIK